MNLTKREIYQVLGVSVLILLVYACVVYVDIFWRKNPDSDSQECFVDICQEEGNSTLCWGIRMQDEDCPKLELKCRDTGTMTGWFLECEWLDSPLMESYGICECIIGGNA